MKLNEPFTRANEKQGEIDLQILLSVMIRDGK